jgi:hypothetical protein
VDYAFWLQVVNVVLPPLFFIFWPEDVLNLHIFSRAACTTTYIDRFIQPPPFRTAYRMGEAITTVGISILYAPIVPISPLIGLVALIVQYGVDQYIILRHSAKPRAFQVEAFTAANYLLRFLPLVQTLLCAFVYFWEGPWRSYNIVFKDKAVTIGVIVWCVLAILPVISILRTWEYSKLPKQARPEYVPFPKPCTDMCTACAFLVCFSGLEGILDSGCLVADSALYKKKPCDVQEFRGEA